MQCCGPLKNDSASIKVRATYWYILETFPKLGRAPTIHEIERDLFFERDEVVGILDSLVSKGALRIEPTTYTILDAYPYSGVPTRHRVYLDKDLCIYCMCAIDTFYVPFLTGCDLTIRSRCFHCRSELEIKIKRYKITTTKPPHSIVIWKSASEYDCPMTNFFCSKEHLMKWRKKEPAEKGTLCNLDEALIIGKKAADSIKQSRQGLNEILWARADEFVCYCREVTKATIVAAVRMGAPSVKEIAQVTTACTGGWCKDTNPRKRCCCTELEAILEAYLFSRTTEQIE